MDRMLIANNGRPGCCSHHLFTVTADQYNKRVVALITAAQQVETGAPLMDIWRELLATLAKAVHDLDTDKMSQDSFNCFRSILQIGLELTKERRVILASASGGTITATGSETHLI